MPFCRCGLPCSPGSTCSNRNVTVSSHDPAAEAIDVRDSYQGALSYFALNSFIQLAAEGRFEVPVARTYALTDRRAALDLSLSGHAYCKLMLMLET